jgi:glutathione S-transferase
MWKLSDRVTVPVLRDGKRWITDSFEIAKFAEQIGTGPRLFPEGKLDEITEWNKRSERASAALRAIMMLTQATHPKAAEKSLPRGTPKLLKPLLIPVAQKSIDGLIGKYNMRHGQDSHLDVAARELELLSKTLSGKLYLIGDSFSYADIVMAAPLQVVYPVDELYMKTGPGGVKAWTTPPLKERFPELLAWRDELYAKHRPLRKRR